MRGVSIPSPQVDDERAVDGGGERGAHFSSCLEVCCERVADRHELWIAGAVDRRYHTILTAPRIFPHAAAQSKQQRGRWALLDLHNADA